MHMDFAYPFSVMLPMCDGQRPIGTIDLLSGPARVPLSRADPLGCGGANLGGGRELAVRRKLGAMQTSGRRWLSLRAGGGWHGSCGGAEFSEFIYSRWLQVVRCRASVVQVRPGALARTPWPASVCACHAGRASG